MNRWWIALVIGVVLVVAVIFLWPRSVRRSFWLYNATGAGVRILIRREAPSPASAERYLIPMTGGGVHYSFSTGDMQKEHLISITVEGAGGTVLTTRMFRGEAIYGKLLTIHPGRIEIGER